MPASMHHLATYPSRQQGRAAQIRLESAGIPSILVDAGPTPYSQKDNEMRLLVTPQLITPAQTALGLPKQRKALGLAISAALLLAVFIAAYLHRTH